MKRGDSVLTSGGILGTIEGLTDQFVILNIADGVRIRILKTQIASGISDELVKK
jgi:preprotein translocase subunit YajC